MGWPTKSTVCGAKAHRNRRQRRFTTDELEPWPPSSTSLWTNSRHSARTAAKIRQPDSLAFHVEPVSKTILNRQGEMTWE